MSSKIKFKPEMTLEEFLDFLDQYWELMGPPPFKLKKKEHYKNMKL